MIYRNLMYAFFLSFLMVGAASAQLDTSSVVAAFGDAQAGVAAIAGVMLAVIAAGVAVKWVAGFLL